MNDEQIVKGLREFRSTHAHTAADRLEALVAEVASLRANEGRVPVSWNECADWLDDGGRVWCEMLGHPSWASADDFRNDAPGLLPPSDYRLLPPSHLVAAPAAMDGGGFLGAGEHVPNGWEWRHLTGGKWKTGKPLFGDAVVQCRPPVKPPQRATVEVPLTQLVGRTIKGCDKPVGQVQVTDVARWWSVAGSYLPFPAGTLDLSTGLVRVYAEGDQA